MTRILFRCDASRLIGSGHVMRCRTLARELQRLGAEVCFLCRRQPGDLINLLEPEFEVLALPDQMLTPSGGLHGRDLYSAWLGCSQEQDAAQCLEVLSKAGINCASWIVADHYGLDARWEVQLLEGLSESGDAPKLLVIDDLADRAHLADLLLDQNFFGESTDQRYQDLVLPHCRQLLGPHYALLGPEYAHLHLLVPPRTELRRVLVFFGGVDPDNFTSKALQVLADSSMAHLAVDVVLGQQSQWKQSVSDFVERRDGMTYHEPMPSLAGLISRADIFIGACGATTWERFCLGCPSITTVVADNQMELAKVLEQEGLTHLIQAPESDYRDQCFDAITKFMDSKTLKASSGLVRTYCKGNGVNIMERLLHGN